VPQSSAAGTQSGDGAHPALPKVATLGELRARE